MSLTKKELCLSISKLYKDISLQKSQYLIIFKILENSKTKVDYSSNKNGIFFDLMLLHEDTLIEIKEYLNKIKINNIQNKKKETQKVPLNNTAKLTPMVYEHKHPEDYHQLNISQKKMLKS